MGRILWNSRLGKKEALDSINKLKKDFPKISFSIGEVINANPFELAVTLVEHGFVVKEIFANPDPDYFYYIDKLAALSPGTMIYSNMEPTMLYYDIDSDEASEGDMYKCRVTLGKMLHFIIHRICM